MAELHCVKLRDVAKALSPAALMEHDYFQAEEIFRRWAARGAEILSVVELNLNGLNQRTSFWNAN